MKWRTEADDEQLPDRCHTVLPGLPAGSNVALCVRGESGVRLTSLDFGDCRRAAALVRAFNESLGIDVEHEKAMLAGCLFGWDALCRESRGRGGDHGLYVH